MDQTPDPAAARDGEHPEGEHRHDVEVRVRRAPKYGVFMAIGAVVGAVVAWLVSVLQQPAMDDGGQRVDTTAVIGLVVVGGFVLGAAAGGIVALLVDRSLGKRRRTVTAEQTDVDELDPQEFEVEPPTDAGEAAFEHLEEPRAEPAPPTGDEPEERDRPAGA